MSKQDPRYCLRLVSGMLAASLSMAATPAQAAPPTSVDLSTYVRVGRYDLPESSRTPAPPNSLLAGEASGVTYNWDTDTLFVVGDGGTSVVQISKTGQLIDSMSLAQGSSPQGTAFYDIEGVTYVGGGMFVIPEERDRQANLFTYIAGSTLQRPDALTVKLGTTVGNVGLEGLSWDPLTSGFIFVKEKDPLSIFQTGIDFLNGSATNGSASTTNSTDLFSPPLANLLDFSDAFALSNLPSLTNEPDYSHVLILSQESGQVINVDRTGTVSSRLTIVADQGSPLSVPDMTMEGLTMDRDGFLYIVNENGGGDSTRPQLWVYASSTTLPNLPPTAVTLLNQVSSLPENTSTAAAVKVADIAVADDGVGTNNLSVTGPDASSFQVIGTALLLKAGTVLQASSKPNYSVTVTVDDPSGGSTPDATANFTLTVTASTGGTPSIVISEVTPWSSGNSSLAADWFEVTNIGTAAANITGWRVDDSSNAFASSLVLNGITSIAPGESVIFIESANASIPATFKTLWFGASPPANLQIGTYSGAGIGLSTGGDALNLFDSTGALQANVVFGSSPTGPTFPTFDNSAGLNNATISVLSTVGTNGAFAAAGQSAEVGSPGTVGAAGMPVVTITATDPNASEVGSDAGTFRVTRTGSTVNILTVNYIIAGGAGQASSSDYTPTLTGVVTIPSGQPFADVTITPVADSLVEGEETLTITLGDTGSYDVGAPASASIVIADSVASAATLIISEVAAWSSGNSPMAADWFEVTNTGTAAATINGWRVDDSSNAFASAVALNGITSIAPGESVIFIESASAAIADSFKALWFGDHPPSTLQIGTYSGSGIGLSASSDALNLYNSAGTLQANVVFGASPSGAPFATFDNAAGLNNTTISALSTNGVNGAFSAAGDLAEIGSPGRISAPPLGVPALPRFALLLCALGLAITGRRVVARQRA